MAGENSKVIGLLKAHLLPDVAALVQEFAEATVVVMGGWKNSQSFFPFKTRAGWQWLALGPKVPDDVLCAWFFQSMLHAVTAQDLWLFDRNEWISILRAHPKLRDVFKSGVWKAVGCGSELVLVSHTVAFQGNYSFELYDLERKTPPTTSEEIAFAASLHKNDKGDSFSIIKSARTFAMDNKYQPDEIAFDGIALAAGLIWVLVKRPAPHDFSAFCYKRNGSVLDPTPNKVVHFVCFGSAFGSPSLLDLFQGIFPLAFTLCKSRGYVRHSIQQTTTLEKDLSTRGFILPDNTREEVITLAPWPAWSLQQSQLTSHVFSVVKATVCFKTHELEEPPFGPISCSVLPPPRFPPALWQREAALPLSADALQAPLFVPL